MFSNPSSPVIMVMTLAMAVPKFIVKGDLYKIKCATEDNTEIYVIVLEKRGLIMQNIKSS